MDTKKMLLPALALGVGLLSSPAMAEPVVLSEVQMDRVAAGNATVDVRNTNTNTNAAVATSTSTSSVTQESGLLSADIAALIAALLDLDI